MWDIEIEDAPTRRRSTRRAVRMPCDVYNRLWTGAVRLGATDLSPHGAWLATPLPLAPGEGVLVRFTPPRWPLSSPPIEVRAVVARAGLARRRRDAGRSGMGLYFDGLTDIETGCLALSLRGLPPPFPGCVRVPAIESAFVEAPLLSARHTQLRFSALGPLLTGGRLVAPPPAGRGVVIPFPSSTARLARATNADQASGSSSCRYATVRTSATTRSRRWGVKSTKRTPMPGFRFSPPAR